MSDQDPTVPKAPKTAIPLLEISAGAALLGLALGAMAAGCGDPGGGQALYGVPVDDDDSAAADDDDSAA